MNPKNLFARTVFTLLLSIFVLNSFAQKTTVTGVVVDTHGEGIIGASVKAVGANNVATITGMDGKFSISVPQSSSKLEVSYIGMQKQVVDIVTGRPMKIVLQDDAANLDEVVVIGYQAVRRKDLTGSVASVSGKNLSSTPVANIAQALQGKVSGVNITAQDGRPDASVAIRVRGTTSISQSSEPLILVDGVPVSSMNDVPADMVESINILKDASSTAIYGARGASGVILITTKGAKEGKVSVTYNGYTKFNTPTKYIEAMKPYDYLKYVWANAAANGAAYQTPFEKLYGLGANAGTNTNGIESYRNMATDDIQKDLYNNSVSWNHDLSITGGTDKTKLVFTANYLDEQGMKINSYLKRANVALKVDQKLGSKVDISFDSRYTDIRKMGDEGTTNGSGSILSYAYRFRPISTQHILGNLASLREGNMEQYGKTCSWDSYSPVARTQDYDPLNLSQTIRANFSMNWHIIKSLTFHTELNTSRAWSEKKYWSGATYNNYLDDATGAKLFAGAVDYQKSDSWGVRWSNTLNYELNLNQIHRMNILAGQEISNSGGNAMRITANHFPSNFSKDNAFAMINQYDKASGISSFSTAVNIPKRILSYFGRANYTLLERYLLSFTFRADASSQFSPLHSWGYFPAGALGWRISEEPFMKKAEWLDNLKLRVSYGASGKDNINSGLWTQEWASETDYRWQYTLNHQYQSTYDYSSPSMQNMDLKWETTVTRNAGLDFDVFKGRLSGTVDLYWNTTRDLLMQTTIPGITGYTTTFANVGKISNKGLEVSFNGVIFKNKDWNIAAGVNINFNKNNVDELAPNVTGLYGTNWASSSTYPAYDYVLRQGRAIGLVRGFVYNGFYTANDFDYANGVYTLKKGVPDIGSYIGVVHGIGSTERPTGQTAYPGLPKYKDTSGDGVVDDKDLDVIGDMNPIHTGGFNFNVTYKNIDFGTNFNWSYGNKIYNANKLGSLYGPKEGGVYENKLAIANNCYKIYDVQNGQLVRLTTPDQLNAANANASLPLANNEGGVVSTLGIEDGSYLRLNTLTLGYTLPKQLMKKVGISNLRIYGTVYNVMTITGYSGLDPEVSTNNNMSTSLSYPTIGMDWGSYPRSRSFVVGVNLSL